MKKNTRQPKSAEAIHAQGVRVNNLKNVTITLPHHKLIAVSGVSGSGKSSLVFDTLFAEGRRRYVESLSAYARQFMGKMAKPLCDSIDGLPPAIAIEQRKGGRNPRSTVGTTTEIYEYLRILFARIGHTISPISGREVRKQSPADVVSELMQHPESCTLYILAPITVHDGASVRQTLEAKLKEGYTRIYVDTDLSAHTGTEIVKIENYLEGPDSTETEPDSFSLLIDRLTLAHEKDTISRLTDSIETAFNEADGACRVLIHTTDGRKDMHHYSSRFEEDGIRFAEPTPNLFSFNSPLGACPVCEGFGNVIDIDEKLVIPHTNLSVYEGCVQCWHGEKMSLWKEEFCRLAAEDDFPIFEPYHRLTPQEKQWLWEGLPSQDKLDKKERVCINAFFDMLKENQYKIQYRVMLSRYKGKTACPECKGTRLTRQAWYVKIGGRSINDIVQMPVGEVKKWLSTLCLTEQETIIAQRPLEEITQRIRQLCDIGLGYLTLGRTTNTLSGGESQRIHLVSALGSSLVGVLYILDEPTTGLHTRDTMRLVKTLKSLRDAGNTIIVVEHDEDVIRAADYLVDVGPKAGEQGGKIVFQGTSRQIKQAAGENDTQSYTIKYLNGQLSLPVPASRRKSNSTMTIKEVRMNNLKGEDVTIPLHTITAVTGVSGSGKSSLVCGIIFPAMQRMLNQPSEIPGQYTAIVGDWASIRHVELIDQSPIGKSTRSNPVTYMKAFDHIRQIFASQPLAKQLQLAPQHFSFNAEGGRCETCKGMGKIAISMQFMADITIECDECHGKRFKQDVLDVTLKGKNINDVLNMSVDEAVEFLQTEKNAKAVTQRLKPLQDVGLGYIRLGQDSTTLSGGESQRLKLAAFLGTEHAEHTLFILDEPTTGLHLHDVGKLLRVLEALVQHGHSVILIEHNLDVIKCADHVIDLGPEGGEQGGYIVAEGTPEEVAKSPKSITGKYLAERLSR